MNKPRTTIQSRFPQFPTLTAFAGALGCPVHAIRQIKKSGCGGFRVNGKVNSGEVFRWLATKGKKYVPGISLEDARARLTSMKVREMERAEATQGGDMVPTIFILDAFSAALAPLESDIGNLANRFHVYRDGLDEKERQFQLTAAANELQTTLRAVRSGFEHALRQGPNGDDQTAMQRMQDMLRSVSQKLSPSARAEMAAALSALTSPELPKEN